MSWEGVELSSSEITFKPLQFIVYLCTHLDVSLLCFVKCAMELFRLEKLPRTIEPSMAKATTMSPSATSMVSAPQAHPGCTHCPCWLLWGLEEARGTEECGTVALWHLWCGSKQISSPKSWSLGWDGSGRFLKVLWQGAVAAVLWLSAGGGRHNKKDVKPHLWGISSLSLKTDCVIVFWFGFYGGQGEVGVFLIVVVFS